ncbi:hypothetical protein C8J57DRAFT_1558682 [Mycena rebaudengoi]|nr:hypothetical protein C8J57DRAFT_1558682 [Mycena rebaudengoi]
MDVLTTGWGDDETLRATCPLLWCAFSSSSSVLYQVRPSLLAASPTRRSWLSCYIYSLRLGLSVFAVLYLFVHHWPNATATQLPLLSSAPLSAAFRLLAPRLHFIPSIGPRYSRRPQLSDTSPRSSRCIQCARPSYALRTSWRSLPPSIASVSFLHRILSQSKLSNTHTCSPVLRFFSMLDTRPHGAFRKFCTPSASPSSLWLDPLPFLHLV